MLGSRRFNFNGVEFVFEGKNLVVEITIEDGPKGRCYYCKLPGEWRPSDWKKAPQRMTVIRNSDNVPEEAKAKVRKVFFGCRPVCDWHLYRYQRDFHENARKEGMTFWGVFL